MVTLNKFCYTASYNACRPGNIMWHAVREALYFKIDEISGIAEIDHKLDGVGGRISLVFPATPPNCVANFLNVSLLLVLGRYSPSGWFSLLQVHQSQPRVE
jgi:hypothetical protein